MSTPRERPQRDEIMALVDGQLEPARRREVERMVRADEELAREVRALVAQREALHSAFDGVLEEAVPARMLRAASRRHAPARGFAQLAMAAGLLVVGAAAGSVATRAHLEGLSAREARRTLAAAELPEFARQAAVAHAAFAPDPRRPVEIPAQQQDQLVNWLSNRLGRKVRAPFLEDRGVTLVGGRLLPGEIDRPAAQFMYQTRDGRRLTLFVRAVADPVPDTAFKVGEEVGVTTFYWVDRDWGYALSGALPRTELLELATAVHQDLAQE